MKRLFAPDFPFSPRAFPFFYGWVIVAMGTFGILASIPGQTAGVGPFTEHFLEALKLERVELSFAYMLGTFASGLLLPKCGQLYDRYGVRPIITITCLALGLSLILTGCSGTIFAKIEPWLSAKHAHWAAVALISISFFFIRFWGQGVITMVSRSMISKWFNRKRGIASSISGSFTSIAFSCSPLVLYFLVEKFGWQNTLLYLGGLYITVVLFLCWLFFRDNPEESGLVMDGKAPDTSDEDSNQTSNTFSEFKTYHEFTAKEALSTLPFWLMVAPLTIQGLVFTAIFFHAVDFCTEIGIEPEAFYTLFIPTMALNIGVGFFIGWLSGKTRLKYILYIYLFALLLSFLQFPILSTAYGKVGYIIFTGIASACFGNVSNVTWPRFFGREHLGKIQGYTMSAMVIGSALGPWFFSMLQKQTGSYLSSIYISAAVVLAFLAIAHKANNPQQRYSQ